MFGVLPPPKQLPPLPGFSIDSGLSALRLALRSLRLSPGSLVAVPAFSCDAMGDAIAAEKLTPFWLDLHDNATIWSDYQPALQPSSQIAAIILLHLYGQMHPQTAAIVAAAKHRHLPIIHDAAQSLGIAADDNFANAPVIYSFGPGKATTAALGATISGIDATDYHAHVTPVHHAPALWFLAWLRARCFFLARRYGWGRVWMDDLQDQWLGRGLQSLAAGRFYSMTHFQQHRARQAMALQPLIMPARQARRQCLLNNLSPHLQLATTPPGLDYKLVLYSRRDLIPLCERLLENNLPYARLFEPTQLKQPHLAHLPNLQRFGPHFIEFSLEASIPIEEFKRLATILANF